MRTIAAIVALLFAPLAGAAYKCVDETGKTQIGDTPPAGCAKVVMYEVTPTGRVLRKIDPTPTPEQLKVIEEEQRRKREADKVDAERKRHDMALLATFTSEKEFDVARDRNIEPLTGRINAAQERIKEIDERVAKLNQDMEFYKSGGKGGKEREVPKFMVSEQERLNKEKQALQAGIAANQKEIVVQRERFEVDKKRWVELRSGQVPRPVADRK